LDTRIRGSAVEGRLLDTALAVEQTMISSDTDGRNVYFIVSGRARDEVLARKERGHVS